MARLFIGHLSRATTEDDIAEFFKCSGNHQLKIVFKSGFGFVVDVFMILFNCEFVEVYVVATAKKSTLQATKSACINGGKAG
jgi:hypothetical protein